MLRNKKNTPSLVLKSYSGFILQGVFEIEYENEILIYLADDGVFPPEGEEHKRKTRVLSEIVIILFVENV